MSYLQVFKRVFRTTKKHCSFCGKHHSEVANLIAGDGVSICNECVLICSGVLMKKCEVYRVSELHQMRDFLGTAKTEAKAVPNGAPAKPSSNSATIEGTPTGS
jgi:hypothetical protein